MRAAELYLLEKVQKGLKGLRACHGHADRDEDILSIMHKLIALDLGEVKSRSFTVHPICHC